MAVVKIFFAGRDVTLTS